MPPDLVPAGEACRMLGISKAVLWRLMATGRLRWYTVEGVRGRRFRRDELEQLIREGKREEK
jgi:excisionase family DNA binding protein